MLLHHLFSGIVGVVLGCVIRWFPADGRMALVGLVPALVGYLIALMIGGPLGLILFSLALLTAPVALGYALYAFRFAYDQAWIRFALASAVVLALPATLMWPLYTTGIVVVIGFGALSLPVISQPPSTFDARVVNVHAVKRPANCVLLVGTWFAGMVQVGDTLTVRCRDGDLAAEVVGIDWMPSAEPGKRIGLLVHGNNFEKAACGDRVVGAGVNPPGPNRSW